MTSSMSDESVIRDLFDRWERVWQEGQLNLVPTCVTEQYIRHDENGDRTVARDAYAKEVAQIQAERQNLRVVVYDHTFKDDRAWLRFAFKWTDSKTGEMYSRAGMQCYRIEEGKLAESWLSLMPLGSTWTDAIGQEHWTSRRQSSQLRFSSAGQEQEMTVSTSLAPHLGFPSSAR
jgi:SnoaL-like polyketide cyclase